MLNMIELHQIEGKTVARLEEFDEQWGSEGVTIVFTDGSQICFYSSWQPDGSSPSYAEYSEAPRGMIIPEGVSNGNNGEEVK